MKDNLLLALHSLTIPTVAFVALVGRSLYFGTTIGDSIALIAVGAVYSYNTFLNKKDRIKVKTIEREIADLKNDMSSIKAKSLQTTKPLSDTSQKRFF